MRKIQVLAIGLLLLVSCHPVAFIDYSPQIVKAVNEHTVAIATIYSMDEEEWQRRIYSPPANVVWRREDLKLWQEILPIIAQNTDKDGKPIRFLAYIGAGTIIGDNHALTVAHLFAHGENTTGYITFAFKDGLDHPVECELIACGNIEANWCNDFAVVRLKEDLGLPGLKITRTGVQKGERVIASGSVGGLAFFTRFGRITDLDWYFNVGEDGRLHLSQFGPYKFWIFYPGGPGDSGGSVKNAKGEIIGVIAWGITVHEENYCMMLPTSHIWAFLEAAGLEYLGE